MNIRNPFQPRYEPAVSAGVYRPELAAAMKEAAKHAAGSFALKATVYDPSVEKERTAFAKIASDVEKLEAKRACTAPGETAKKPRSAGEILVEIVDRAQETGDVCVILERAPSADLTDFWQSVQNELVSTAQVR